MTEQDALKILQGTDARQAALAEATLWRIWSRSGRPEVDVLVRQGVQAMQRRRLQKARELFNRIVEVAPEFAEGWNKRATVRYLAGDFVGAIADCHETLARNPNHFGALSGQGLCHLALGQYHEAAQCFRRTLQVHPYLSSAYRNLALAQTEAAKGNGKYSV